MELLFIVGVIVSILRVKLTEITACYSTNKPIRILQHFPFNSGIITRRPEEGLLPKISLGFVAYVQFLVLNSCYTSYMDYS